MLIQRNLLIDTLSINIGIAGKGNNLPVLQNVLVESGEKASFFATDTSVSIRISPQLELDYRGKFLIPKTLLEAIKTFESEMIDVEITGSKLLVSQGKTNIEFTPHDVLDYPEFKEPGQYNSELEISGGDLLEIIEKVSFTAANGNEAIKHSLNGIYLEGKEGKITACGTNGCRMAIFQKEVPNAEFDGIVIPKEVLPEMKRVVNKVDTIKLKIADTKIILEKDGLFFAANLIDDTYPDFKSIIPDDLEQKLTVEKNAFVKGIKMVMTIIEKTEPIKVTVTGNKMELGAENDTGTIKRVIAVETEDCKEFGINPVFLLDAISHIEANKICMEFSEKERKPVMIRNEGYTHLIMPVIL